MPDRVRFAYVSLLASLFVTASTPLAFAAPRPADAPPDTAVVELPLGTVVTASRLGIPLRENPGATTLLGRDALGRSARQLSIGDALAGVPGLRIEAPADAGRVHLSIRGQGILTESGIRGIKLLLDGLPLNDPSGIAPDAYDVDWATADRVEVLRGPAAALYGGGGSAGVINVTTADGAAAPLGARAEFTGGSYGFQRTLGEVGGTAGALNWRGAFSHAAGDGWRAHNAFASDNAYAKLKWTPGPRLELQQVLAWTDYDEQNAEGLNAAQVQQDPRQANPDAGPFDERFRTGRFTAGTTGRIALSARQWLRFAGWVRTTRYTEPRVRELVRRDLLTPGASAQYDLDLPTGGAVQHLSAGTDVTFQSTAEMRFYNPGAARQDSLLSNETLRQRGVGVFALDRIEWGHDWSAMAAVRWDDVDNRLEDHPFKGNADLSGDRRFQRGTVRAGVAWTPRAEANLFANVGQGFLPPATEQLVNNPDGYGGFNRALVSALSTGGELGARGVLPHAVSYELTAFVLATENDFDRYRLTERPGLTFYRNSGESRRYGVEARLGCRPLRALTVDAAYTGSHFRYVAPAAIDGHTLPNSPDHQLALDARYTPVASLTLGVDGQLQSDWELDTANSAKVPGYALWGAHVTWRWRAGGFGGEATLAGRNLLGAAWMAYTEPDPDGNSYQPGPQQEYFARIRFTR